MSDRPIDWDAVKRRLQESQQALERALAPRAEDLAAVYRERAAALARPRAAAAPAADTLRVLVFALGTERYALEFADLVELLPLTHCTPVPGGPPALRGVTNVHGEIRSVVDLGRLLGLPARVDAATGYLLLVRRHGRQVGLHVDALDRTREVPAGALAVPAAEGAGRRFLRGLTPDRVRLLNTEAVLTEALAVGAAR